MSLLNNMRVLTAILVVICSMLACKSKIKDLPLEKATLVNILTDIYIAEGMVQVADISVRDSLKSVYMLQVADKHSMSIPEMEEVLKKLSQMPDTLYVIQGMALDSLRDYQLKMKEKENTGIN